MIAVRFRIHVDSPLRIGAGLPSLIADDTVVRDADGQPIVPATTLKGNVRAGAAAPDAGISEDTLARTFGRPDGASGLALFGDAAPSAGQTPVVTAVTRVSLSDTRTARRGRLMTHEVVLPFAETVDGLQPLTFEGGVRVPSDPSVVRAVVVGLASVRALGAERSRGRGEVRVAIDPTTIEPLPVGGAG